MRRIMWFVVCALLYAHEAGAAPRWIRLRSDHFFFIGDTSEREIRDIALHLEQFREAIARVLPSSAVATLVPTIVFVFQNDGALTPYKPTYQGKPVALAGFFSGWADRNVIAINAAAQQTALRVVFHEYGHFLVQNTSGQLPPWANEGLAGFYEMFEEGSRGQGPVIGVANEDYLALLKNGPFVPLRDLLAIDYSSSEYNESSTTWPFADRRTMFYAESWALMHYLQLGDQRRTSQLTEYLARLHDGGEPGETFAAVFGDPASLERELRDYVRRLSFPSIRLASREKGSSVTVSAAELLDDVTTTTYLSDLLARTGHVDEARRRLEKILAVNPTASAAAETLGVLELNAGNTDRAVPWLERAARDRSNLDAQVLWGRAVIDQWEKASIDGSDSTASINDARMALSRAAELRPGDAEALAVSGRAESIAGDDVVKALELLTRAVALAPGQEEYRLMLAEELVRQREFARAADLLGPLAASARTPEIREAARRVMSRAVTRERAIVRERAAVTQPDLADSVNPRAGPLFRILRADETRALGMLRTVECEGGRVVLHVETENESLRLSAVSLSAVEFVSYPTRDRTAAACGPVSPPSRVFATYVESDAVMQATGIDGRATAIEVLPDGYEVR
jgi:tetratricopeptide (TPR) repeat protein